MPSELLRMKRAHSSATLSCEPEGLIGIAVVAPAMPSAIAADCSHPEAVVLSAALSWTGPLLM